MLVVLALVIGIVSGLRAMTAPAAVSWAARLGWLDLSGTGLSFGGRAFRGRLATAFGSDRPAAFIEDGIAIGAALAVVMALP